VPEVESKPEPELKQAAETANSKVVVDTSDDVGVEDALAGGDGSEIKEGEQEGLKQPEEEQKPKPFKVRCKVAKRVLLFFSMRARQLIQW